MDIVDMEVREAGDGAAAGECLQPSPAKKYTWAEVRQAVHDLRKELSSLSTMVPMDISFRKLSNGKTRIYFLRTPQNGWEITLLYADVTPSVAPYYNRLEWKPLIESNAALGVSGKLSREEQLLWERQRMAGCGIASYELHARTGRVLFPCASALFVATPTSDDDSGWQGGGLVARALTAGGGGVGAPLTPAMCPEGAAGGSGPGGALAAHAARGDVWLCGERLRRPQRLTYACRASLQQQHRLADDPKQAGVPCYVTQEEFSRYTGFWWQPVSTDDVYRIVYEEVDESEVKILSFPSSQSTSGEVEEFRFPRAGTPNAKSILRLVTFRLQKATSTVLDYYQEGSTDGTCNSSETTSGEWLEVCDIRWYDLKHPLSDTFPWSEYLARVGWTPCGQFVWAQLLDRKQQRLELILIPLEQFCVPFRYEQAQGGEAVALGPHTEPGLCEQVLITETAPNAWINVHDILHFLGGVQVTEDGRRVELIWLSERSGHAHLYYLKLKLSVAERRRPIVEMLCEEESLAARPEVEACEAITSGEWEVLGRRIWVDPTRSLVYFIGLRETPLERHLYAASYATPQPEAVQLLTSAGHSCTVFMDNECTLAVITSSNIATPPCSRVYRIKHQPAPALVPQGTLQDRPSRESSSESISWNGSSRSGYGEEQGGVETHRLVRESSSESSSWNGSRESSRSGDGEEQDGVETHRLVRERALSSPISPQIFSCPLSCGSVAFCALWRAPTASPAARAPTVLHVYGGPEVQTVTNCYKGIRQLRMQMLAARGFNVVAIDSRGSKHRGRAWETAIQGKLGQLELDDQVEVLQWLAKETGCIDMERVAIHGWSYGGYLALLGLATRPNTFKVCVSGAPVTCWRLYDTAYTERYMGEPSRAPHKYTRASVLAHAPFFPDQEGRLLIIHGLADENVHFSHTSALLAELVRLGKPHRVQIYPGERHSLRAMHAAKHYEATLLHFLHENL